MGVVKCKFGYALAETGRKIYWKDCDNGSNSGDASYNPTPTYCTKSWDLRTIYTQIATNYQTSQCLIFLVVNPFTWIEKS